MKKIIQSLKDFYKKIEEILTVKMDSKESTQEVVITLGAVAIVMLVILVISFAKPVTEQLNQTLFVEHFGSFDYRADSRAGIYDKEYAQTGEPFFWDITDELHLEFSYWTNGVELKNFQGMYIFTARLEDEHGWKRSLPLGEETVFQTHPITFSADLILDDIAEILNSYQRLTGISRNNYFLVIEPVIRTTGNTAGMVVQSEFSPELRFYITTSEFYLVNDDQITLEPELIESVTKSVEQGGTLSIFTLAVPVRVIRWVSLVLLVIALALFGIYSTYYAKMLNRQDPDGLDYRYGTWMVDTADMPQENEMSLIAEFEDLIKIATLYDLVILHTHTNRTHYYYLKAPEGYFYYRISD
jgi:Ca2+/Na+ antiporter